MDHEALIYARDDLYAEAVAAWLRPAAERGEPALLAVVPERLEVLAPVVDAFGDAVEVADMRVLGGNPGRIIPAVQERLETRAGETFHVVGENIWPGRTEDEAREVLRHEALVNVAWAGLPVRGLCPYDMRVVDAELLADVAATHPLVASDGRPSATSETYRDGRLPPGVDAPLAPAPGSATCLRFGPRDLFAVRAAVSLAATAAGLRRTRAADLVLAVNELATNSLLHAGSGGGVLRLWRSGPGVTCEVADAGHITDPLTGRLLPEAGRPGGRGLWLVHQLCDLVELRTGEGGTTVRVQVGPGPAVAS